jgi:hypothetical protein
LPIDVQIEMPQPDQRLQPDEIFIRRAPVIGRDAPMRQEFLAVPDRKDGIGVAGVDAQQHGA